MIQQIIRNKAVDPLKLRGASGCILYLNPETYIFYRRNPSILENVRGLRFDGLLFSTLNSMLLKTLIARRSFDFTSLAHDYFLFLENNAYKVVFIGATEAQVESFSAIIKARYPRLNVVALRSGYGFEPQEFCVPEVDFFLVGMGGLLQDRVAIELSHAYPNAQVMTCGAFISQTATSGGDYYPHVVDKFNLRFLYRFFREPRVIRRVVSKYPIFIGLFIWDFLRKRSLGEE